MLKIVIKKNTDGKISEHVIETPADTRLIREISSKGEKRTALNVGYETDTQEFVLEPIMEQLIEFDFTDTEVLQVVLNETVLFQYTRPAPEYQFKYLLTNPLPSNFGRNVAVTEEIIFVGV